MFCKYYYLASPRLYHSTNPAILNDALNITLVVKRMSQIRKAINEPSVFINHL